MSSHSLERRRCAHLHLRSLACARAAAAAAVAAAAAASAASAAACASTTHPPHACTALLRPLSLTPTLHPRARRPRRRHQREWFAVANPSARTQRRRERNAAVDARDSRQQRQERVRQAPSAARA
eukprot:6173229-Pleurochrysis_carterae.AAC.2